MATNKMNESNGDELESGAAAKPKRIRTPKLRFCSLADCAERHYARGFCYPHYYRARRYGDQFGTTPPRPPRVCSIAGCGGEPDGRGFCGKHYSPK